MIFSNLKFKAIVMLIALFLMCFVFMIQTERELEAFALSSTVIIGILVALAGCGLYVLNFDGANSIATDVWNKMTDVLKADLFNSIDESTRILTLSDNVFDFMRGYIEDNYIVGQNIHQLQTNRVLTRWGGDYAYTLYPGAISSSSKTITQELYDGATKYTAINWGSLHLEYQISDGWYDLYINNINYDQWDNNGWKLTEVNYYDSQISETIYFSNNADTFNEGTDWLYPYFSFFYNITSEILYPVVIRRQGTSYKAFCFRADENNAYVYGETTFPIDEDVSCVIDGTIVLDPDYDIIDRTMPLPYEIGQIIGQSAGEVIAEQWADVMTIDRYIELYGSIPVSLTGDLSLQMPDQDSLDWSKLHLNVELITDKFPFSIPFDLAAAIENLVATPEVPVIEQNLTLAGIDGGNLVLDFTPFQPLANIIKWGILILFNIGLILLTRRIIRG